MAKVISIDNFGRETVSDVLVKDMLTDEEAKVMAKDLNEKFGGPTASRFYVVKPDSYQLYRFEP